MVKTVYLSAPFRSTADSVQADVTAKGKIFCFIYIVYRSTYCTSKLYSKKVEREDQDINGTITKYVEKNPD